MGLPAIAGLSLLLVGGQASADQQGWPVAGRAWNSLSAASPSSFGSYSPPSYATYQTWIPPGGSYGFANPLRPLIEARQHHLDVAMLDEPILVEADVTRMAQVLLNLLNNAAKYTPEGGDISLTVEWDNGGHLQE
jgi:hypothetical protein